MDNVPKNVVIGGRGEKRHAVVLLCDVRRTEISTIFFCRGRFLRVRVRKSFQLWSEGYIDRQLPFAAYT